MLTTRPLQGAARRPNETLEDLGSRLPAAGGVGRAHGGLQQRNFAHEHGAAPWHVIPSNHKWFRDLAVSEILASAFDELAISDPKPSVDIEAIRRRYHQAELDAKNEVVQKGIK